MEGNYVNRHKVTKIDLIWGYLSQILNMASSLLLLPFILKYLDTQNVGVWYVFITMIALIQLLEFGFLPTISRYVSYIYAGSSDIKADGLSNIKKEEYIDIELLANVIIASKKIYLKVALFSFITVLFIGVPYLSTLTYSGNMLIIYFSWVVYGLSYVVIFYFNYYNSILKGRGDQTQLNKIIVVSKITNVLITILLLHYNFGLLSIAIGALCGVIVDRILVRKATLSTLEEETCKAFTLKETKDYSRIIWKNAKKMGLVQLGNFFTVKSSLLVVSSFIGLEAAAKYGLTLQITSVVIIIASMYFGLNLPYMNTVQIDKNKLLLVQIFSKSIIVSWVIYIVYFIFMFFLGGEIIQFLSKDKELLSGGILFIFLLSSFLEMNHSLCTAYLTTKNEISFVWPILVTGILIIVFSILFGQIYGLWGVVLSQFILQILYNNWKWPLIVFKELKINIILLILSFKGLKWR